MYKKGAGNDKQGKDEGNRTLCPYRNFSQAISSLMTGWTVYMKLNMYIGTPKGGAPIKSVQFALEMKISFSSQGNVNRKLKKGRKKEKA